MKLSQEAMKADLNVKFEDAKQPFGGEDYPQARFEMHCLRADLVAWENHADAQARKIKTLTAENERLKKALTIDEDLLDQAEMTYWEIGEPGNFNLREILQGIFEEAFNREVEESTPLAPAGRKPPFDVDGVPFW